MSTRAERIRILVEGKVPVETSVFAPSPRPSVRSPWDPGRFASEQLTGLVRHIFLSGSPQLCRQVVLSAVDSETDIGGFWLWVCRHICPSSRPACLLPHPPKAFATHNIPP